MLMTLDIALTIAFVLTFMLTFIYGFNVFIDISQDEYTKIRPFVPLYWIGYIALAKYLFG